MKIMVLGADGYLGWPVTLHLAALGHTVIAVDSEIKRFWTQKTKRLPMRENPHLEKRGFLAKEHLGLKILTFKEDVRKNGFLANAMEILQPDTVIHFAEQPSAPYSMMGWREAQETMDNNLGTTFSLIKAVLEKSKNTHIIKLGTMGEYGTPNFPIGEGWLEVESDFGPHRFLYPAEPGSLYHTTKVQDTHLLWFYSRVKGITVTDIMQGPVYGLQTKETQVHPDLATNFHYDDIWGTVLNRFTAQAVREYPLTVYGIGEQTRGFLCLRDVLRCISLLVENRPSEGEFRIVTQFTGIFTINALAKMTMKAAVKEGLEVKIGRVRNPRKELGSHQFEVEHNQLKELGHQEEPITEELIQETIRLIKPLRESIQPKLFVPKVQWQS